MVIITIKIQNREIFYAVLYICWFCFLLMYIKSARFQLKNWDAQAQLGSQPSQLSSGNFSLNSSLSYSLALGHSLLFWPVWAEFECTVRFALPKWPINQNSKADNRAQALWAYCSDIDTVVKILIWVLQRKCSPDTGSICILYAKEATIVRPGGKGSILVGTRNRIFQKIGV